MLVVISTLKSSFLKIRLQEVACRWHEADINLYRAAGPQDLL